MWTLIPALLYRTAPHDVLEGIAWGRQWLLGYDKHPFLAPWITAGITDLFDVVGWPAYLASQISIAICFWAVWSLARSLLDPWRAFVAVALLEGDYFYNIGSFTFSPDMLMLSTWAMTVLTVHRAVLMPARWRWLHAGFWAGLAILAKYESVVLFTALLAPLLLTDRGRLSMRTAGPYMAGVFALLIASPNLIWLAQHDFVSLHYASGMLGIDGAATDAVIWNVYPPLKFLLQQLGVLVPVFLLLLLFPRGRAGRIDLRDFNQTYVLAAAFGPLLVALLVAVATGARLYVHWGIPFFSFLGLALVMLLPPQINPQRLKRLGAVLAGLTLLLGAGLYASIFVRPRYSGVPPYSITFPSGPLAAHVTTEWRKRYGTPLSGVAGARYLIASVCAYSKDKPTPFFDFNLVRSPWWDSALMRERGIALVAQVTDATKESAEVLAIRARYPDVQGGEIITLPHLSSAALPAVHFWIGYVPPQSPLKVAR